MANEKKITYPDFMDITKKIDHPFSREIFITTIKKEFGKGVHVKYDFGNGIAVFARNFTLKEDIVLIEEGNVRATVFIFNLGSSLPFVYKDGTKFTLKKDNFLAALTSEKFSAEILLKKNQPYISVSIGIKEELFMQLAHPIENIDLHVNKLKNNNYTIFEDRKIDPQQFEILNHFKDENTYEDLFENLFLESKTTDLMHYTIGNIAHNLSKIAHLDLDTDKINSLEKAKYIILNEYHTALSIKKIAHKSAINECYLKKDFKAYYGMTIYEMLQKHRMENAKQLLQKRTNSIKEVALKVGYKHSGNFSKTFVKYFGLTPGEYKKEFKRI